MAQKKRRHKHRGTQAGTIDRRGRTSRPRSRNEARQQYRAQRMVKHDRPPSWRSAANRGLIAAGIFLALLVVAFRRPPAEALSLAAFMLAIYIPMGYFTDSFFHRRRQRRRDP